MINIFGAVINFIFNPAYSLNMKIRRNVAKNLSRKKRTLDFGCGTCIHADCVEPQYYIGVDVEDRRGPESSEVKHIVYSGNNLSSLKLGKVEQILCLEVLEHISKYEKALSELTNTLVPGGIMVISVPFIWPEHETPNDFNRFTIYGLSELLLKHNCEILECKKIGFATLTLFTLSIRNILRSILGRNISILLCAGLSIICNIVNLLNRSQHAALYTNTIVVVQKIDT